MKNILGNPITTTLLCLAIVGTLVYLVMRKQTIDLTTGEVKNTFSFKSTPKK